MNIKMGLNREIFSSQNLGIFEITDDLVLRIVTENAGPSNTIVIKGRIKGQSTLSTLLTITGSISETVTVATYEEIEIECTVYDSLTTSGVKIIATSFDQDVSSVAVPIGAATSALQNVGNASLDSIDSKTPALVAGRIPVDAGEITGTVEITNDLGSPIPISASSLPLPSGAATEAKQDEEISKLTSLDDKTPELISGKVPVDVGSPSVTVINDELSPIPISAESLPLPTGAATAANQSTTNSSLASIDLKLPSLTVGNRVPVDIGGDGSITITSGTITVQNEVEIKNDTGNPVPVSATSLPLPTGASTETTLSSIDTKTPELGQAVMTGSVPVAIASDQSPLEVSQSGTWNITNISGIVSLPTGAATEANQTTANTHLSNIAATSLTDNTPFTDGTTKVLAQGFILDETAGTALAENDIAAARIDDKRAQVLVLEDSAIRGRRATVTSSGSVQVDGSAVTQPISASSLPLPTGAATESTLSNISGKLPTSLGQTTSAQSLSVTVASDQSPLPISGTITSTQISGVEDAGNSSTTPLIANAVFTGSAFNVTGYVAINVNVKSDVPSAIGGIKVEFSPDGINWDHSHSTTYTAATGVGYIFNVEFKFARIVYTNGATPQTIFRLQTIHKTTLTKSSLYTLSQAINSNMFAELGRSVITGETTAGGGGYVNVKVDPSGAMITATTIDTALPAGDNNIGNVDIVTLPISYSSGATDAQTQRVVLVNDQTIPISATSLPLPTGAATSSLQTTGNTAISTFSAKSAASMVAVAHDEVVLSYVGTSNRISSVVYKLATSTVATLTFSYDGSNRLTGVVRS